jgi:hypothetical protein
MLCHSQYSGRDRARPSSGAPISVIPSAVVVNRWNVETMIHFGVVLEANRRRYWKL